MPGEANLGYPDTDRDVARETPNFMRGMQSEVRCAVKRAGQNGVRLKDVHQDQTKQSNTLGNESLRCSEDQIGAVCCWSDKEKPRSPRRRLQRIKGMEDALNQNSAT